MDYFQFILYAVVIILQTTRADKCKTPNNEEANCVSLYDCPILSSAFADPSVREFLRQSNCGGTPIDPLVCCGTSSNFTTKKKNADSLLPSKRICGLQHSDDYFHTVNDTAITEFPWLALIEYISTGARRLQRRFLCSGSLINARYVLTAGQCLMNPSFKPVGVRLGEFHITNETDCIEDSKMVECSDSVRDYGIEKIIVHPEYVFVVTNSNDIGLIRLNETVTYSDYIRPICLPAPETTQPKVGDLLLASGWGMLRSYTYAERKKRTYSKIITKDECENAYASNNLTLALKEDQICGLVTSDSEIICRGDGGGPVMYSYSSQWHQIGIVSFGSKPCLPDYPEVYTRVSHFRQWIEENLEP